MKDRHGVVRLWRLCLVALVLALGAYLVFAAKPWTVDLGGRHRVENYWIVYSWVAAVLGMGAAALLCVVAPWWAGREVRGTASRDKAPRWFWPLVVIAMALSAGFSLPRLSHSLWDDEEINVRKSILGSYRLRKADEPVEFKHLRWSSTALEYREPNNHVLNSLLSRACHEVWFAIAKPTGLPFVEWPLRLPSYVVGVLGIGSIAWMLWVYGFPHAGVLAAFLAALHPWYVRYTAETRGYAFALLFVPVVLGLWHRAVFRGGWKWWAALGVTQLLLVYAYPGTLFVLIILNAVTPWVLLRQPEVAGPFVVQSGRWFCVNALAAIPALFGLLPLIGQVGSYVRAQSEQGFAPGGLWLWNTLNHFVVGTPWWRGSTKTAAYPEVVHRMGDFLPLYHAILALTAVLLIAGVVRFARLGPAGIALVATIIIPPLMTIGFAVWKTQIIYEPYVLFALPGALALVSVGAASLLDRWVSGRWARLFVSAAIVVGFAWLTQPTRAWLIRNSVQPIRESVLVCRGTLDPADATNDRIITASFCIPPYLYDPKMIRLDSVQDFIELLRRADSEQRPLLINIGMPWAARAYSPAMWQLFNDPALFDSVSTLRGLDPGLDRIVVLYKPGSATDYDFSNVKPDER